MSNLRQFLSTNETIQLKAKKIYGSILSDYNNGKIKSQTEFVYRVKNDLMDFYNSIGKPTFKPCVAYHTPVSSDYNEMISTAFDDINNAILECVNLNTAIGSTFIETEMSERTLGDASKMTLKVIADLKDAVESFTNNDSTNVTDSFTEKSGSSGSYDAYVNPKECILTLPVHTSTYNSYNISLSVVESNGLPGNTHVVSSIQDGISFDGSSNLRASVHSAVDKNKDSWFEYEIFEIDDDEYNKCNGLGFTYKEGVSWITEDGELYLKLRAEPKKKTTKCNWFSITPYIPPSKSYTPAVIERVVISDSSTGVQDIRVNRVFDDSVIVTFKEQQVSFVDIYIRQKNHYTVDVGHMYTIKLPSSNSSIYDNGTDNIYNRVDLYKPSLSALGVTYNPKTGHVTHGHYSATDGVVVNEYKARKDLFEIPETPYGYKSDKEIISARRYMIGVKEINLSNYSYKDSGVYLSETFTTKKEINSVTLNSTDSIPAEFESGEYIKYYLSFDDGGNWHRVYPKDRAYLGACTIKVNSDEGPHERAKNNGKVQYIDRLLETNTVKVKIVLTKPKGAEYSTPVVYNYRLEIITGDEEFDS